MTDAAGKTPLPVFAPTVDDRSIEQMLRELPRFSPAAAIIADCAPTRLMILMPSVMLAILVAAGLWAWLSEVDIVTTASGRVVPSARVKTVQPLEPGVVRAIRVREGDVVKAGMVVVDLDPTETRADRDRLARDSAIVATELARLKACLAALNEPPENGRAPVLPTPPDAAPREVIERQRLLLGSQWRRIATQREVAAREQARLAAGSDGNRAQQAKNRAVAEVLRDRVAIRRSLAGQELLPRSQLLELQQTLVEMEQEAAVLKVNERLAEAELASAVARQAQVEEDTRERLLGELAEKERSLGALEAELSKAEERAARRALTAPVDGVVVDLAVHTVGGVVREAEPLMRIVPEHAPLEVEALVKSRDIGFVREGRPVEVKVDTFSYTRYGTMKGRVASVGADATGGDAAAPVYKVRVTLDAQSLRVDGVETPLNPGMTVTVDVKTGQRRVLDFLLEPVMKYRSEALRDR